MTPIHWNVDPELIRVGGFALRWYSLMFAGGFLIGHRITQGMWRSEGRDPLEVDTGMVYTIVATILGARLAHCFFYDPAYYFAHPLEIFMVWTGGLASHGGFAAVFFSLWILTRKLRGFSYLRLVDRVVVPTALVACMIRLGNLFNSEIIGRPTDLPWAVVFERVDQIPRHPGQVYEAIGYFCSFLVLLWAFYRTQLKERQGFLTGLALVMTTSVRFGVEFLKENQSDFEAGMILNMGQLLSIPFFLVGVALLLNVQKNIPWLTTVPARSDAEEGETQEGAAERIAARKAAKKIAKKSGRGGA